jgi:hypothetical protein
MRVLCTAIFLVSCGGATPPAPAAPPKPPSSERELRAPEEFSSIADTRERSSALFLEASRVILHPRCTNCHPADDTPRQRNGELHDPPIARGDDDHGVPALRCSSCHQDTNVELARVPGAPDWRLAPKGMAWLGKTPPQICEQLKDSARNGGRTLAAVAEHSAHDKLVAWGWAPGSGRPAAPGSQERFAALVSAWIATGAVCPSGTAAVAEKGAAR